ncbi:hypothetical protein LJ739_07225 [Aestuariibacter halophilus]|uniref:Uncharacterized protein n=1 Tax=Fluctibacter halophilus TaxID=226011 RepID=A0ABS8G607_9ALTE|nr:hypothetical protein [Aestuariibacter halophilus]MCC2616027.1 hypothetical protein [Aestuariibacter halophilus]
MIVKFSNQNVLQRRLTVPSEGQYNRWRFIKFVLAFLVMITGVSSTVVALFGLADGFDRIAVASAIVGVALYWLGRLEIRQLDRDSDEHSTID